ncbi:MAG: ergothioneine biosynthesis protein EgtB [Gemmatimonadota bacterium]
MSASQPGPSPAAGKGGGPKAAIREALESERARTLQLTGPLSSDALVRQHSLLMSPIVWDLGHIAAFEQLWLVERLDGISNESSLEGTYDAFRTPRSERGDLNLADGQAAADHMHEVREAAMARFESVDLTTASRLLQDGFVYDMVRQHEAQHQETILQTIQLMESEDYDPAERMSLPEPDAPVSPEAAREMVRVLAGEFDLGAAPGGFTYDNERPRQSVNAGEFKIGRYPVCNRDYLDFVLGGGYGDRSLWTDEGWAWKEQEDLVAPLYWRPDESDDPEGLGWSRRTSLGTETLRPDHPVIHVCGYEAEAYARFRGCRLPTETEWEKAAAWDPKTGQSRRYPWGSARPDVDLANLDQLGFGVAPLGAYPRGVSALGCEHMLGDVWEWTSSTFKGYDGFEPFPYAEYSEMFFGDEYWVLRGGSWATRPSVARNTSRNWDYPKRRQIMSGIRLARDT